MAVVAVDGGDERARAREGESREGRRGRERVRERSEGAAWRHPKRPGRSGKQEVARGGVGARHRAASGRGGGRRQRGGGGLGLSRIAGLGGALGGLRVSGPGRLPLSPVFFIFLFCFLLFNSFATVLNLK